VLRDLAALAASADPAQLGALGAQLRAAGLNARALAAWAGTTRVAALPARLDEMSGDPATPAGAVLALFVACAEVARDRLGGAAATAIDALVACGLIEGDAARLRARIAIVPIGSALLVCDRLDAAIERDLVCWPDDSSHHLASAIPAGRRADWLDLGCGSAFAPLARPELAHRITGIDLNPRAVRYAQLGATLSGISHLTASQGDVADRRSPAELVTCNAPMPDLADAQATSAGSSDPDGAPTTIPGPPDPDGAPTTTPGPPRPDDTSTGASSGASTGASRAARLRGALPEIWRHADAGFFPRLWPALRQAVRPGGLIVVHGACAVMLPALAEAPGERVVVRYTPDGAPGFAIAWWRPDAPARLVSAHRALTAERPHLDPRDRDDALATT